MASAVKLNLPYGSTGWKEMRPKLGGDCIKSALLTRAAMGRWEAARGTRIDLLAFFGDRFDGLRGTGLVDP
jgi:hypothetical protein